VCRKYGVLQEKQSEDGARRECLIRSTFVIDKKGVIAMPPTTSKAARPRRRGLRPGEAPARVKPARSARTPKQELSRREAFHRCDP